MIGTPFSVDAPMTREIFPPFFYDSRNQHVVLLLKQRTPTQEWPITLDSNSRLQAVAMDKLVLVQCRREFRASHRWPRATRN